MKFRIEKKTRYLKTNIDGKVMSRTIVWLVYRPIMFGLFRAYVKIEPKYVNGSSSEYVVDYVKRDEADEFSEKRLAEMLVLDISKNPDKFVRIDRS